MGEPTSFGGASDGVRISRGITAAVTRASSFDLPRIQRLAATAIDAAATSHGRYVVTPRAAGGTVRPAAAGTANPVVAPDCSAAAKSAALLNRSAGSFASARPIAASTPEGIVGLSVAAEGAGAFITLASTACALGPVNGGSPTSIS